MKKKVLSLALALILCLSLAAPAMAADSDFEFSESALVGYKGPGGDVVIPDGTGIIPDGSPFYRNDTLTSVTIPDSVAYIGMEAFAGCKNLKTVILPRFVFIRGDAFANCTSLTDVYFAGTREDWANIEPANDFGVMVSIFGEGVNPTIHYASNGPDTPPTPVTPDMRSDSDFVYDYWEYEGVILSTILRSYRGPGGDLVIPDGIDNISNDAFYNCRNLTSVVIPSGVEGIYFQAFAHCSNLKSITIPASVTDIGADIFLGCRKLTDVYFGGTREQWAALEQQLKDMDYGPMFGEGVNPTVHYNSSIPDAPKPAKSESAMPTNDQLTVNGALQSPTVYKIGGSNYFKIRDLAAMLSGTEKQFDVGYDGTLKSVTLTTGKGYAKLDTDLAGAAVGGNQTADPSNDSIYIDGQKIDVTVYKINGSNYFKLRDLGRALGFYVGWTAADGVFIDTSKPYSD